MAILVMVIIVLTTLPNIKKSPIALIPLIKKNIFFQGGIMIVLNRTRDYPS